MNFNSIFKRTKNILFNPAEEWILIDQEKTGSVSALFGYALPFIIANTLTSSTITVISGLVSYSLFYILVNIINNLIAPFVVIIFSAIIINALAPSFGSEKNIRNSIKLVTYSYTTVFLTSLVSSLIPIPIFSSLIGIAGLYSAYTLWIGISPLMKTPEEKKTSYAILSFIIIMGTYSVTFLTF